MAPTKSGSSIARRRGSSAAPASSAPARPAAAPAAHAHFEYEFGGPLLGPVGIVVGLPLLVFIFANYCGRDGWPSAQLVGAVAAGDAAALLRRVAADVAAAWRLEALLAYVAYFLAYVLLSLVVPGPEKLGAPLPDGRRLSYKLNGLRCQAVVVAAALYLQLARPFGEKLSLDALLLDNFEALALAMIAFSFLLSAFLYAYSFAAPDAHNDGAGLKAKVLAAGGDSGISIYDFFIGRELNPRVLWGALDLKFFCELRPGLTLWLLINIAAAFRQASLSTAAPVVLGGWSFRTCDPWMALVLAFEALYVVDSVWNEEAILTTMDITTDGFGFMLAFGDLAWVPIAYSLQARFLAERHSPVATPRDAAALAGIVALAVAGMYIFRGANSQKDAFKADQNGPEVRGLRTIATSIPGRKLLAGGWWGVARHINYFGDWVMSVAWSLPTGLATPVTYFYPFYFAVLLVHRDMRDGEKCAKKYGKSWDEYCKVVRWRIIPFVY